ncbi:hypothetical protein HELRODRAFT_77074 [Helobdella robusta]|uniref:Protein bicaudal D n=1 Tax=Helobdella robusta TaxID=6412 RepID=T1G2T0_HELRO|nr:hypothetical protein HELRODRAFT_77074 [Helobdella robusta]ESO06907.1 hypothetical protein HELRODRAFT_77074 [Helobdella robusta]
MDETESLMEEIERLRNELDRAVKDREKAAEYGLAVLEEKQNFQTRCEQAENLYETTQLDLKLTKDTLAQLQGNLRKANELGLTHEEGLLQDEEVLRSSVNRLNTDLRNAQHTNQELTIENEKACTKINNLVSRLEEFEALKVSLRNELRELKMRESQLSTDFAELEEENVLLQKQLMQMKQSQVDFESIKYENKQLTETVEELNQEVEALDKLKEIVEKNLVEALELLQREREEKCHLKKELDQRISSESVHALQALASTLGLNEFSQSQICINSNYGELYQEEHDNPTLKKLEADFVSNQAAEIINTEVADGDSSFVGDLFSEIHVNEVKKLENLVEKLEAEKNLLEKSLQEANENIEVSKQQVKQTTDKVVELENSINAVNNSYTAFATDSEELKNLIQNYSSYESAINQILKFRQEIAQLSTSPKSSNFQVNPEIDVQIRRLETEVEDKTDMVNELTNALNDTCNILKNLSKDLSEVYRMMCAVRSEVPNKNVLQFDRVNKSALLALDATAAQTSTIPDPPYIACRKLCDFVMSQISTMTQIMGQIVESEKIKQSDEPQTESIVELKEQNSKLKIMLATKRDQIATLRSVLKSNKNTAETALASLKQRFDSERQQIVNEVQRLRSEVQSLKEDKATFASLRASFAQRCDEYLTQLDEQQLTIINAQEEKKTLNSLLRMAMQQKMEISSRYDELVNDREARKQRTFVRGAGASFQRGVPRPSYQPFHPTPHLQQVDDRFLAQNSQRFPSRRDF